MNEHKEDFVDALLHLCNLVEELAQYRYIAKPNHTLALLTFGEGIQVVIQALENEQDREAQIKYLERMFSK